VLIRGFNKFGFEIIQWSIPSRSPYQAWSPSIKTWQDNSILFNRL